MSDFLTELRGDLVDAHERHGRRGRGARLARPVHPRTWRPAAILAAAAAAACLIAGVVAIRALHQPVPASIRIVATVPVGGQPVDGVLGFGSLWVADFDGSVVQVDPAAHRVVRRIRVGGSVDTVAAGGGAVWATTEGDSTHIARLVRIDPRTGRVTDRRALGGVSGTVEAAGNIVWLMAAPDHDVVRLARIDPATGRTVAGVRTHDANPAATIAGGYLWTLTPRGVVEQRELLSGRVLRRVYGLGSAINYSGDTPLAADASGLWVFRPGAIVRLSAGGAVRRMPLRLPTLPTLGDDGGALWVATGRQLPTRYGLARLDRGTAKPTGTLDLGTHQPKTLIPSPRGLWVVCADGIALLVR